MIKRLFALLIALLLFVTMPVTAFAAGAVHMSQTVKLSISHVYGDVKLQGVEFEIYLVSTMDDRGELTPTQEFAAYESMLDIRGKNDEAWYAMADTLNSFVQNSDMIQPTDFAVTNEAGITSFPTTGKTLEKGLYLVTSTQHIQDGYIYTTLPFMVLLPGRDSLTDEWEYDVSVNSKPGQTPLLEDYEVVKIWEDYGYTDKRPESITIQLLCDGEPFGEPIKLPYEGNWSYIWEELEVNHDWSVKEFTVDHYTSEVVQEGNTFVVTNTLNDPKLPQTGQLNWPIPAITIAGLVLFVTGWILCFGRKRERNEK